MLCSPGSPINYKMAEIEDVLGLGLAVFAVAFCEAAKEEAAQEAAQEAAKIDAN